MRPRDSRLFREDATPLLNQVKRRNRVLQQVLRLMSLSRPGTRCGQGRCGASTPRGRISYAQLGIDQLGAVYEALLAYRGFFAEEDLYDVKPAGKAHDALGVDLNPVALELAEVSLWLDGIHRDGHVPSFGFQPMCVASRASTSTSCRSWRLALPHLGSSMS